MGDTDYLPLHHPDAAHQCPGASVNWARVAKRPEDVTCTFCAEWLARKGSEPAEARLTVAGLLGISLPDLEEIEDD